MPRLGSANRLGPYPGGVLELSSLDLDMIAEALADQNDYDARRLIDPRTGEIVFWTRESGIDGEHPVDLDDLDLVSITPLPSRVWYQDMADFGTSVSDEQARGRLLRAIDGRGAFRRFGDELHQVYPQLLPAWRGFLETRARRRAVDWLAGKSLIDDAAARRYLAEHPDPGAL
jgi:hypothetical protein